MPCAQSLKLIFGEDSRLQNIFAVFMFGRLTLFDQR